MSSWQDELDQILSNLNVHQESHETEFSLTQAAHDRPGVFYRLDLVDGVPELRVYIPTDDGAYKMDIYLVTLAPQSFLAHTFGLFMIYDGGSSAYQEIEGGVIYYMLLLILDAMKELFWQGDLFHFPPEIEVRQLL